MAFIYTLTNAAVTNTDPAGTDLVSLGDDNIRNFKSAMYERVNSAFVDVNANPWVLKSPAGGAGNVQSVVPASDNLYTLGTASLRYSDIRSVLGTIGTLNVTNSLVTAGGVATFDGTFTRTIVRSTTGGDSSIQLLGLAASGHFNWLIAKSWTAASQLQFVPSTVADGTTFTTPAWSVTTGGVVTATSFTGNLTGTVLTAAQPNITSLGTLTGLNTAGNITVAVNAASAQLVLDPTAGGASDSAQILYRRNGVVKWQSGNNISIGGDAFELYSSGVGNVFSVDHATRAVTFTGTVTAANFVGPTTIDANNLTGTTLNAGVVNSSLTSVGVLTSLRVLQPAGFNAAGVTTYGFRFATDTFAIGSDASNIYLQSFAGKTLQLNNQGNPVLITGALTASGGMTGNVIGNVTGTILTAAQGNITSLGTLTSLNVAAQPTFTVARTIGTNVTVLDLKDNTATGAGDLGFGVRVRWVSNSGAALGAIGFETGGTGTNNESQIAFYTQPSAGIGLQRQMTVAAGGQVLFGTTSINGVAAGGIHVAGNSVFDGVASFQGLQSLVSTDLTFSINGVANYWALKQATGNWSPITDNQVDIGDSTHRVKNLFVIGAVNAGSAVFTSTVSGITTLTATTIFGTLATAAQTNITSVGALGSLTIQSPGNTQVALNTTTNATTDVNQILFERGSTIKWRIGTNIDGTNNDALIVFNNVLGNAISGNFATGVISFPLGLSGALTGNVTGNLTGTILTAAQANITSLGTLTSLTVSGAATFGTGKIFNGGSTTVGAAFVTIYTFSTTAGGVFYVFGDDGTNSFIDVVACTGLSLSTTATAIGSVNTRGAPAARLYRVNSVNLLQMSVGSGSYTVKTFPHEIS